MLAGKDDITAREQARSWIDSVRDKWRLQILAKRVRVDRRTGERKELPTRIRRFVEGLPWAFVKPALDYLLELAPYSGVIVNGVDFGVAYRPTLTVWQRDAQSAAVGAVRQDATYTLVQDLVEDTSKDFYGVATSSSCSESVETEYVWDAGSVEDLPQGGQGVTYGIAAVNRKDDGTFDYQVIRRQALTQHVPETVVKDDAVAHVTQELWDNVYTDADGRYVDHTGAPIDVPAAGVSGGVATRIENLSENPDCTLKFQVVREASKDADGGSTCRKTVFEHEHGTVEYGQSGPPGEAPDAGGGRHYENEGKLQPDGTFVTTSRVTTELERPSGKDIRRTTRAVVTTTTTRNTATTARTPDRPGGRESHEMTPGGRYNLTVTTAEPSATPDSARCAATVFEETDDKVTMQQAIDPSAHGKAGDGRHQEVVQDMDEYGVVKKTVRTTTEKRQESGLDIRRTTRAVVTTTTTRNTDVTAGVPSAVGGRESHEMTPGGRYNLTVTTAEPSATPDSARCAATVFEETDDRVTMHDAISDEHGSAGGGRHSEVVQDMDEYGVVKKTVRTTTEKMQESGLDIRRTTRAVVTTTTTRNTDATASVPDRPGGRESHEMTPGGRYNLTVTTAVPSATPDSARCAKTVFEEVHDTVDMTSSIDPQAHGQAGGGAHSEVVQDMDEYGVVKRTVRNTRELPRSNAVEEVERSLDGVVRRVVNRNMPSKYTADPEVGGSVRNEENPGGSWNQTIVTPVDTPVGDLGSDCDQTHLVHTHGDTSTEGTSKPNPEAGEPDLGKVETVKLERTRTGSWKMTKTTRTAKPKLKRLEWDDKVVSVSKTMKTTTTYRNKYVTFRNQEEVPDYVEDQGFPGWDTCSPSVQINEFGLYDGVLHMRRYLNFEIDEEVTGAGGHGSGPGEQGDKHSEVTIVLRRSSGGYNQTKTVHAHRRILWSTRTNMLAEVADGICRPDLGLVSRLCGWYAEIYSNLREEDWENESRVS